MCFYSPLTSKTMTLRQYSKNMQHVSELLPASASLALNFISKTSLHHCRRFFYTPTLSDKKASMQCIRIVSAPSSVLSIPKASIRAYKQGTMLHIGAISTLFHSKVSTYGRTRRLVAVPNVCSAPSPLLTPKAFTHSGSSNSYVEVEDQPPSWLFVSPAVAGAYGAQVNVDLDLESRLSGEALQTLTTNIWARHLEVDLTDLLSDMKALKSMEDKKTMLQSKKNELLQDIRDIKSKGPSEDSQKAVAKVASKLQEVKAEIASLKSSWDLQEKVMLAALRLPNDIHTDTPFEKSEIIKESKAQKVPANTISHIQIAKKFDLIKFSNIGPKAYFLKSDLVLAEMALTSAVCDFFQVKGYRHMSGPEFVKTPIVEGCGGGVRDGDKVLTMVDPHKTVVEPMNHISGVSLHMFAAYVAKTCIGDAALPLKMFACGRNYQKKNLPGLFGAVQTTQAAVFSCVESDKVDQQFETTVALLWDFIQKLGFTTRLCQVSANNLELQEKRRVDIEVFSPGIGQFVQVASLSDVGDYISRRLMVTHNKNHADIRSARYVHMVHGTALNITYLLALWMEYSYSNTEAFSLHGLPDFKDLLTQST